ncbi:MAG TPA: TCP-1/cpn60 chaperonin family protein [Nitrososphaeraceae archaeon]|nr:TCP-1/cpn60 chaperonin family protein [Nitrososphaeraceae archaeon]
MDKILVDSLGDVPITNDDATILREIDVQHPAAKMMVVVYKSVDDEVVKDIVVTMVTMAPVTSRYDT